jgi:hypothetical protein
VSLPVLPVHGNRINGVAFASGGSALLEQSAIFLISSVILAGEAGMVFRKMAGK